MKQFLISEISLMQVKNYNLLSEREISFSRNKEAQKCVISERFYYKRNKLEQITISCVVSTWLLLELDCCCFLNIVTRKSLGQRNLVPSIFLVIIGLMQSIFPATTVLVPSIFWATKFFFIGKALGNNLFGNNLFVAEEVLGNEKLLLRICSVKSNYMPSTSSLRNCFCLVYFQ